MRMGEWVSRRSALFIIMAVTALQERRSDNALEELRELAPSAFEIEGDLPGLRLQRRQIDLAGLDQFHDPEIQQLMPEAYAALAADRRGDVLMAQGKADEATELRVSKFATIGLGIVAVLLGMAFEKMNIAFMVALAFGVAASANFPVLILSMYWKGLTTKGALVGGYSGLVSAVLFVLLSKSVWVDVLGNASAIFPYTQPALFSMPIAFFTTWLFSTLDSSKAAVTEKEAFEDQYVRAQTGVGAATASSH